MNTIKIGKQIALLRKQQGLTGEKFAEILSVSPQAVSKWETGKCLPETATLPAMARVLNCSIDEILMPGNGAFFFNKSIENEVRKQIGKSADEDLTENDVLAVAELKFNNLGIGDIRDLEQFKNLTHLEIMGNCINDLSPLTSLTKLETLLAGNCPFSPKDEKTNQNNYTDLKCISNLTNLKNISFTACEIVDISFIRYLVNLENAWLYSNRIEDISPIKGLINLKKIYLFDCRLTEIEVIRHLSQLEGIAINMNQVSDLSPLENCLSLSYLDAHDNRISNLAPLNNLTKMVYLTLANNNIVNLDGLRNMQQLEHLTLSFNPVARNIDMVKELRGLKYLELREINITDEVKVDLKAAMPECNIYYTYDEPGRFESE
jgi:Leucine-rich repeat (LRR) protein